MYLIEKGVILRNAPIIMPFTKDYSGVHSGRKRPSVHILTSVSALNTLAILKPTTNVPSSSPTRRLVLPTKTAFCNSQYFLLAVSNVQDDVAYPCVSDLDQDSIEEVV